MPLMSHTTCQSKPSPRASRLWLLLLLIPTLSRLPSCKKDKLLTDGFKLEFETDSVEFDTVFSALGGGNPASAHRSFKVYNRNKEKVSFRVRLAGGNASPFRMNVDGIDGADVQGYELRPGDSAFIFVEVFLQPGNQNNPFLFTDSIYFESPTMLEKVRLVAYGQDAHYIHDTVISTNTVWDDDKKPYVLYNFVGIEENTKLTIKKGVHIYSHNNMRLYVLGTLDVQGDTNKPVIFEGDRLEYSMKNVDNQWRGIRFLPTSFGNKIENAIIKNATIGIEVDSISSGQSSGIPNLTLNNVQIRNMSLVGLLGLSSWIKGTNMLVANCGLYTFLGNYGGNYEFTNCTFASYNTVLSRKDPHFGLSNQYFVSGTTAFAFELRYKLKNCLIYGDQDDEIEVVKDVNGGNVTDSTVEYCLIKTKKYNGNYSSKKGCLVNQEPQFANISGFDFLLGKDSPAKDKGDNTILFPPNDLTGYPRNGNPDIGCYEVRP